MPKLEELPKGSVRKRQATEEELEDVKVLVKSIDQGCFNSWEIGFIETLQKRLIDAEEFQQKDKLCVMLSDKQFDTIDKLIIKLGNEELDQGDFYHDA